MGKILDDIRKAAGDRQRSTQWYRRKIKDLGARVSSRRLINQGPLQRQPSSGKLNFFFYVGDLIRKYSRSILMC